jgi:CHAD domain-containing protein
MAFRLKQEESVSHGLRRLAHKVLRETIHLLQPGPPAERDEAVHEGRKNIKKTRALLELVRHDVGHTYRRDKKRLRRAAEPLSAERDAKILLDTFDKLHRRHRTRLHPDTWRDLRLALADSAVQITRRAILPTTVTRTLEDLARVDHDSGSWSFEANGFRALRPGLEHSFARARKAWRHARRDQMPATLHGWRKRVKTHWYQTRLVESIDPRRLRPYLSTLRRLETWLGDHHNLTVLHARIEGTPMPATMREDIDRLSALIVRQQLRLQRDALALGARVYSERRTIFINRLEQLWDRSVERSQ